MALLTRDRDSAGQTSTRGDLLEGHDPADVLMAMEALCSALLDSRALDGIAEALLADLGLYAATRSTPGEG